MFCKGNKIRNPTLFTSTVLAIIVIAICIQNYFTSFGATSFSETHYNNYTIFKQSFFHLIHHTNLYQLYPKEQWDYFKYSPTFALFMAPFTCLPDFAGLLAWYSFNGFLFLFAIRNLPLRTFGYHWLYVGAFALVELITSIQNSQCNPAIAGLIVYAFIFLEQRRVALATLCISLTIFIKLFGIVAILLLIFYPEKVKMAFYMAGWIILLLILPTLLIPFSELFWQYQNWIELLRNDHTASIGISVMGLMHSWFGISCCKNIIVLTGAVLLLVPLIRHRFYNDFKYKLFYLCSLLIWMVIFNHKAESATYIIAVTGVAIWFFSQEVKRVNVILLLLAFLLTVMSPSDLFPRNINMKYVVPFTLKALPCILIWLKIVYDLLTYSSKTLSLIDFPNKSEIKIV